MAKKIIVTGAKIRRPKIDGKLYSFVLYDNKGNHYLDFLINSTIRRTVCIVDGIDWRRVGKWILSIFVLALLGLLYILW